MKTHSLLEPLTLTAVAVIGSSLLSAPARACGVDARPDAVRLSTVTTKPVLLAGQNTVTHLKVGLTGFELAAHRPRTPLNLAIVLDRSGSMIGEKLARAKEAAQLTVQGLRDDDIVSVIIYDSDVHVLVPATKATSRDEICAKLAAVQGGSDTALFAGVSKGAEEARKFATSDRVNRIILLSDGLANVGPSSPSELADFGASLAKEGLAVTTIGLGAGYNEDLMTQLAARSDGRHAFIERPAELASLFRDELGMMMAVVAQKVSVEITCDPGVKPVRVLGRPAVIAGPRVSVDLNHLYAGEEKYIVLEVEVPATGPDVTRDLARVAVRYENLYTKATENLSGLVAARFSSSPQEVEKSINQEAMVAAVTQIATAENERATALRDAGRSDEAKAVLLGNAAYLRDNGLKYHAQSLRDFEEINRQDARNLDELDWSVARKLMKDVQFNNGQSQGRDIDKAARRRMVMPSTAVPAGATRP